MDLGYVSFLRGVMQTAPLGVTFAAQLRTHAGCVAVGSVTDESSVSSVCGVPCLGGGGVVEQLHRLLEPRGCWLYSVASVWLRTSIYGDSVLCTCHKTTAARRRNCSYKWVQAKAKAADCHAECGSCGTCLMPSGWSFCASQCLPVAALLYLCCTGPGVYHNRGLLSLTALCEKPLSGHTTRVQGIVRSCSAARSSCTAHVLYSLWLGQVATRHYAL